jgi:hypothetical protein
LSADMMQYCPSPRPSTSPYRQDFGVLNSPTQELQMVSAFISRSGETLKPEGSNSSSKAPSWLRGFGGPFAVLCGALTGIVPFVVIAIIAIALADSGEPTKPDVPPMVPVSTAPQAVDGLWAELQRQASAQRVSEATQMMRLQRIEEALNSDSGGRGSEASAAVVAAERARDKAEAAAKAAIAASKAASKGTAQTIDSSSDALAGLGIDWASWSMGAQIDRSATSPGLGRNSGSLGALRRLLELLAPSVGRRYLPVSQPPEVVLTSVAAPPSRCFTIDSSSGSIAIRFVKSIRPAHVVIEQMPQWATDRPMATPRHVEIFALPSNSESSEYVTKVASFEYQLEGPRLQVFALASESGEILHGKVDGLKFAFQSNWGEDITLICRVRVFGE